MKKLLSAMVAAGAALFLLGQRPVHADETWDKPVVTLGTSLTTDQKDGTIQTLTSSLNGGSYETMTVTGDTLVKYLNPSGSNFTSTSGVWSSAMVNKTASGGINVHILDYKGTNNITTITADQYRNAALTAGVTNADIYITSAVKIDGSGALAGVYAAFAQNGQQLNQAQVTAAQDEVNTLSDITQANKDTDGYSDKQLNNAVAGMKQALASQSNNGEQTLSQNQIGNIVDSQLKNNNLGTIINNNQRNQIINLLVKIQDSGALNSDSFKQQASKLADSIQDSAKGIFSKIKDAANSEEGRNFFQKLMDALTNFFNSAADWVKSLIG